MLGDAIKYIYQPACVFCCRPDVCVLPRGAEGRHQDHQDVLPADAGGGHLPRDHRRPSRHDALRQTGASPPSCVTYPQQSGFPSGGKTGSNGYRKIIFGSNSVPKCRRMFWVKINFGVEYFGFLGKYAFSPTSKQVRRICRRVINLAIQNTLHLPLGTY